MAFYTFLTAYILYIVVSNTLKEKNIWEQAMAIFIIVPLFMRLFFIK